MLPKLIKLIKCGGRIIIFEEVKNPTLMNSTLELQKNCDCLSAPPSLHASNILRVTSVAESDSRYFSHETQRARSQNVGKLASLGVAGVVVKTSERWPPTR